MADHVWGIGGGAEMMIRDRGIGDGHVEFWFRAGSSTWNNSQGWGYDAGWGYIGGTFKLSRGGAWHHLATVHVPTSRNVMMRILGSGLGWSTTDRSVWINRATTPPPPHMHYAHALGTNSARVHFTSAGDGGTPIREWQITYSTNPHGGHHYVGAGETTDIHGLSSGEWWYFWARGRNDMGWGGWSGRSQAFTWRIPDPPSPVWFEAVTQTSLRARFRGGFDGGESVDEWQLAYGLDPNSAEHYIGSNGTNDLFNLVPGATYYFWARGRNAVGWSHWSSVRAQTLRAGAMVKHGGVWRRALPYQKVNGVWSLVRPRVKHAGVWKETS